MIEPAGPLQGGVFRPASCPPGPARAEGAPPCRRPRPGSPAYKLLPDLARAVGAEALRMHPAVPGLSAPRPVPPRMGADAARHRNRQTGRSAGTCKAGPTPRVTLNICAGDRLLPVIAYSGPPESRRSRLISVRAIVSSAGGRAPPRREPPRSFNKDLAWLLEPAVLVLKPTHALATLGR